MKSLYYILPALLLTVLVVVFGTPVAPPDLVFGSLSDNTHATDLESGSEQNWSITDAAQTGLDFSTLLTFSGWVYFESAPGTNVSYALLGKYNNTSSGRAYQFVYQNLGGTPRLLLVWSGDGNSPETYGENVTLNTGQWYHIAATFSGSGVDNRTRIYLDGSQLGSGSTAASVSSLVNNAEVFRIGAVDDSGGIFSEFDGLIDDVRVWSRELTPTEIGDLYTTPCSFDNGASLQGHWAFDNDGTDLSGNGNTLTNNNSATFSTSAAFVCAAPPSGPSYDTATTSVKVDNGRININNGRILLP